MFVSERYEQYRKACQPLLNGDGMTFAQFRETFGAKLADMEKVVIDCPAGRGVLYYRLSENEGRQVCVIPAYGLFASSVRVLTELFSRLSGMLVPKKSTLFQIHLYAADIGAQKLFSMMQFGFMAETGLARVGQIHPHDESALPIRTLNREMIAESWNEIWEMTSSILRHLQNAPVFYPCRELTEQVYRAFFLDEGTHLHVAFDEENRLVGMVETNGEQNGLIRPGVRSANIGEIFVVPDRRGTGLSDALFDYALSYERKRGAKYLWVEHGTANPQARGFWGRYFHSYEFEMDRFIERY